MWSKGASTNNLVLGSEKVVTEGKKLPQYIAALTVCLGSMATGSVLGWTGVVSEDLKAGKLNGIPVDKDDLGRIGSFATLGAMVTCFPVGIMCDKLGRKLAMLLLTIPFVLGWLIIVFAVSVEMIFAGRFITGLTGGAFCVTVPLYTSEIAEKDIRGALGSYFQLLLTVGIFVANVVGTLADMKVYTIILTLIPLIFSVAFLFQPETPVFRIKQDRVAEAKTALVRLRGNHYDVDAEVKEIKTMLETEENNKVSFFEAMKTRSAKMSCFICFSLMFFMQASGVNVVIFYTGSIFESSGAHLDSKLATIIVGAMQVIATFTASVVVDKMGRRILLLCSDFFMAVSSCLLGVFFMMKNRDMVDEDTLATFGFLPVVSLSVFMVTFALGFGPITWLVCSELFPQEIKSVCISAAATISWFLAFLITKFYINLELAVGTDVAFCIFAAISFVGTAFVFFFVPETKGKSLDEIQKQLSGEKV